MILATERPLTDEERIERWRFAADVADELHRSDTGQSSSDAADYSQPSGWEVFQDIACGLLFVAIVLLGAAAAWAIHSVAVEPETRCFSNAAGSKRKRTRDDRQENHCV